MYSGACFVILKKEFLPNFDRKIKKSFRVYLTQAEGFVTGLGSKMFVVSGPVLVFGLSASVFYGVVLYVIGLFQG